LRVAGFNPISRKKGEEIVLPTCVHSDVAKSTRHMPRSTSQVADHSPASDTLGKGIEQLSVKGFAGEFLEERLRILPGNLVIAGFDGPGG